MHVALWYYLLFVLPRLQKSIFFFVSFFFFPIGPGNFSILLKALGTRIRVACKFFFLVVCARSYVNGTYGDSGLLPLWLVLIILLLIIIINPHCPRLLAVVMILFFIINLSPNIKNNPGGGLGCYTIYNVVFISSKKKKKETTCILYIYIYHLNVGTIKGGMATTSTILASR